MNKGWFQDLTIPLEGGASTVFSQNNPTDIQLKEFIWGGDATEFFPCGYATSKLQADVLIGERPFVVVEDKVVWIQNRDSCSHESEKNMHPFIYLCYVAEGNTQIWINSIRIPLPIIFPFSMEVLKKQQPAIKRHKLTSKCFIKWTKLEGI